MVFGDVDGSVDAIMTVLDTYDRGDLVKLDIIDFAVGPPNLTHVQMAVDSNGTTILSFVLVLNGASLVLSLCFSRDVFV